MTENAKTLTEIPKPQSDILSDLLGSMHLAGTVLFRVVFRGPWSVAAPDSGQLARALPFRTERIIPFHLIASGGCWLDLRDGRAPLWLNEGDAVLLSYGNAHCLSGCDDTTTVDIWRLLPHPPWNDLPVIEHGSQGPETGLVCGFLQCDELLFHPILRHLPACLHVNASDGATDPWLTGTIRRTIHEATKPRPGSRNMLPRLTELMFVEILRNHIHTLSATEAGWFAALKDPVVGACLKQLHELPIHGWTIEQLTRLAGVSRTVLMNRFKHFLGQPPMQYLANWRLLLAAQALKSGELPVKSVAEQSGYESEAAFSRAFKRQFGLPPADWRKRQMSV